LITPKPAEPKDLELYPKTSTSPISVAQAGQGSQKTVVKSRPIRKVRPGYWHGSYGKRYYKDPYNRYLPPPKEKGWELDAEVFWARVKGKFIYRRGGIYGTNWNWQGSRYVDANDTIKIPEHWPVPSFSVAYRFRHNWAMRYSVMSFDLSGSGTSSNSNQQDFVWGNEDFSNRQNLRTRWERLYQRLGLVYDPIRTQNSRVGIFGEWARVEDKIGVMDPSCCQQTMNNDLNMCIAGLEFEKALRTGLHCNTLSIEAKGGIAFLDEAIGADSSVGVRYSIPLGKGRWGYLAGGYRYLTYKKGYSDNYQVDSAMEGGYLKMGFIF
jgi:hypothetical protein